MINFNYLSIIIGTFAGLGALIAGIGFAYSQFKSGGDKAKNDLIDTLKETALVEREKATRLAEEKATIVDSHQGQINDLSSRIGKLQGLYEASEVSKKEYLSILQGRDPQQKVFMEETTKILVEIRMFMEKLNKDSNSNQKFLDEVDDATAQGKGKVLRKEV